MRTARGSRPLSRPAGKVAGRRVAGWSPGRGRRSGEALAQRIACAGSKRGTGPGTGTGTWKTAGSLAGETLTVRAGSVPGPLVARVPGTGRAGTRRSRLLLERMLAVPLSRRRTARERALRGRVRRTARRRSVVPRPVVRWGPVVPRARGSAGRPAAGFRPAVAGRSMARAGLAWEIGCPVWAGYAPLRKRRVREPGRSPPADTGSAALTTVLPRASAAVWPGAGVGLRLPGPAPRKRSHGNDRRQPGDGRHPAPFNRVPATASLSPPPRAGLGPSGATTLVANSQ